MAKENSMRLGTRSLTVGLIACALLPQLIAAATTPEAKQQAFEAIERNAEQIALVGDSLFYFGELGMQELESTKFLKETLEGIGFTVELGGAGMPTKLWATWGTGKPLIVIATEGDALPQSPQTPHGIQRQPPLAGA